MKMVISFIDSDIYISNDSILSLEIENKNYFYRIISNLNQIANGNQSDDIIFFDDSFNELNFCNKIEVFFDYFNIDFNTKKIAIKLNKILIDTLDDISKLNLTKYYDKIVKLLKNQYNDLDLQIVMDDEYRIENLLKLFKIRIDNKNNVIDNILLLIDIEKTLNINEFIVFVNLKQYLSKEELNEIYKYSLYNNIKIILIDSQSYDITLHNEKKFIIDDDLEEFMI